MDTREPAAVGNGRRLVALRRRGGPQKSIKRRVVRLVLIPSVVAVVLWLVASGYLVFTGFYDREVASTVRQVSIPAVTALSSIQQERRLSIVYVTERSAGAKALLDQRRQTDQRVSTLRAVAGSALSLAPQSIKTRWKSLDDYLAQLPAIRKAIDSHSADQRRVYGFYNGLLDSATDLFDTQARVVPDVTASQGGITATETFRATDLMSRASSIITGAFGSGRLSRDDYLQFVQLVGAYHSELTDAAAHLRPAVRERYQKVTAAASWRNLVAVENTLISSGPWTHGIPGQLGIGAAGWNDLTATVSNDLIGVTIAQADEVSAQALRTGNNQLLIALLGSLIALAVAAAAIWWAVRQSQVLVDNALSIRLAQLGRDAATVVDQRLPEMMGRLRRREKVDPAVELPSHDYGEDEIGQLADVLNRSLQVAVGAAVDEATTRAASTTMLMGVARRPQRTVQRGLKVIEDLQQRTDDEKMLAELFDVNHQLAQTRRFLENLAILAGGHTGRRFHRPVPVRRVLLAAIAETQQYRRVTIRHVVDVALDGSVVASTTHLLAELLDNALTFSPPNSEVWVSSSMAQHGLIVEIEDAGVGMLPEARERANDLLASAPAPDLTLLKDGAQVGLWVVAELAKRIDARVTLRPSAYGGLLAVVLLPERVTASGAASATDNSAAAIAVPASAADSAATDPATAAPAATATMEMPLVATAAPSSAARSAWTAPPGTPGTEVNGAVDRASAGTPAQARTPGIGGAVRLEWNADSRSRYPDDLGATMTDRRHDSTAGPTTASTAGPATAPSLPPLPTRQPQQHLAPELREEDRAASQALEPVEEDAARSPEQIRDRFTRYQRGWRDGGAEGVDTPTRNTTGQSDGSDGAQ